MSDDDTLRALLAHAFPGHDPVPLMAVLQRYGERDWHRETARVHAAIVALCAGDPTQLPVHLAVALEDYRDVLAAVSLPAPSAAETEADTAAVRDVLERWGKH